MWEEQDVPTTIRVRLNRIWTPVAVDAELFGLALVIFFVDSNASTPFHP